MQPPVNASLVSRAILTLNANLSAQSTKSVRVTWPVCNRNAKTHAPECVAEMLSVPSTTTTQIVSVTRDIPAILSMFVIGKQHLHQEFLLSISTPVIHPHVVPMPTVRGVTEPDHVNVFQNILEIHM